jgi:hypothetical protein
MPWFYAPINNSSILFTEKEIMDRNPLQQYFRQPAIFIRLPSGGKFYPSGSLDMPPNGELGVLPMTTMDEITYRTPDALFNGSAVVSVIQSCVPNIKDAWCMPSIDIDAVLAAIRVASYGHDMEINIKCPNCNTESDYTLDLRRVMDQIQVPDYSKTMMLGDLELFFKPMTYQQLNDNNLKQFEDQKIMQNLQAAAETDEEKVKILGEILKKITQVTVTALSQNISLIKTPQTQVTENEHINEWLSNCDRKIFNKIKDQIIDNKHQSEIKPLDIKCDQCAHEYKQVYTLDVANFFEDAS